MSDETPVVTPIPTVTHSQEVADQFVKAFEGAVTILPQLSTTHPTEARFVRGHLNASAAFLAAAIEAAEQNPTLQSSTGFDTVAARNAMQMMEAFTPVINRITAVRDSLQHTLWAEQAAVTNDALNLYAALKALGRNTFAAAGPVPLLSHVSVMKEALGRRGPKPKTTPTPTTTTQQ